MTDTQKVIINYKHGGFGISDEAAEWLMENRGWTVTKFGDDGDYIDSGADLVDTAGGIALGDRYNMVMRRNNPELRSDPDLIDCIETLDSDADGRHASLKIVEIPVDVEWQIEEYDGAEWVAETHRTWG